jgi:hypothetical protein
MILVALEDTRDARPALQYILKIYFASFVLLELENASIPSKSLITNGISITVDKVLAMSIQKKKPKAYPGLTIVSTTISVAKIKKQISIKM